jgi:hypothetical protein
MRWLFEDQHAPSFFWNACRVADVRPLKAWRLFGELCRLTDQEIVSLVRSKSYRAPLPAHVCERPLPSAADEALPAPSAQGTGAPSGARWVPRMRTNFHAVPRQSAVSQERAEPEVTKGGER